MSRMSLSELLAQARSGAVDDRVAAIRALANRPGPLVQSLLCELLDDHDVYVQARVAVALAAFPSLDTVRHLLRRFESLLNQGGMSQFESSVLDQIVYTLREMAGLDFGYDLAPWANWAATAKAGDLRASRLPVGVDREESEASMTEAEWLACDDPAPMLRFLSYLSRTLTRSTGTSRQVEEEIPGLLAREPAAKVVWLFCCACARRGEHLGDPRVAADRSRGVEATESFLDGRATAEQWRHASVAYLNAHYDAASTLAAHLFYGWRSSFDAAAEAAEAVAREQYMHPDEDYEVHLGRLTLPEQARRRAAERERRPALARLVRCIFGNPFRHVEFSRACLTATVRALANAAHQERALPSGELDTARLAVLSDGLEEAGCADVALLSHLREPGPHVRGCWALDLVLGKD